MSPNLEPTEVGEVAIRKQGVDCWAKAIVISAQGRCQRGFQVDYRKQMIAFLHDELLVEVLDAYQIAPTEHAVEMPEDLIFGFLANNGGELLFDTRPTRRPWKRIERSSIRKVHLYDMFHSKEVGSGDIMLVGIFLKEPLTSVEFFSS